MKKEPRNNNTLDLEDYKKKKQNRNPSLNRKQNPYKKQSNRYGEVPTYSNEPPKRKTTKTPKKQTRKASGERPKQYREPDLRQTASYDDVIRRREAIKNKNKLSNKQKQALERRRKQQSRKQIAVVVFMGILVSYVAVNIIDHYTHPPISYQTVRQGMIDNTEILEGIIVREETVVTSKEQGDIHYIIGEGEKVAKGGDVCFIADDAEVQARLNQMSTLDESLYNIQDKRTNMSYFQTEIHQLNLDVMDEMKDFYYSRYWENPTSIYTIRKELEKVIQERTNIYINDETELTEDLHEQRVELQNQIRNVYNVYEAQDSGTISYQIDYLENTLTEDVVQQLSHKTFNQINPSDYLEYETISETQEATEDNVDEVAEVEENETELEEVQQTEESAETKQQLIEEVEALEEVNSENNEEVQEESKEEVMDSYSNEYPLYKIITDDYWDIVTYVKNEDASAYDKNKSYDLFFNEYSYQGSISFELVEKVEEEKYTKLIFSTNQKLSDFLDVRFIEFSIGENKAEGLKIPLEAIIENNMIKIPAEYVSIEDDQSYVYKMQGEQAVVTPIDIQYKYEIEGKEYMYVLHKVGQATAIQIGETLRAIEGEGTHVLNEVETVRGVYSINGSYAKFKPIEVKLVNDNYAILQEGRGTDLKEFDQIISNPQSIREDQLLTDMSVIH